VSAPRMGAMRDDQKIAEARPSLRPDTKAAPTIISSLLVCLDRSLREKHDARVRLA
jgi:hypothetical protein